VCISLAGVHVPRQPMPALGVTQTHSVRLTLYHVVHVPMQDKCHPPASCLQLAKHSLQVRVTMVTSSSQPVTATNAVRCST
jgi:hypothetical protein